MKKLRILSRLRKSKATKITALVLVAEMLVQTINPPALLALTSGPTQPEVEGFQPIGVSDMVDPFTGDFSYNVPLLSVGDYPLNLAYQSGVTMDEEASWAGLGWNVHTGAITRQLRGIPDDFWGDPITRKVHLRDNLTIGAKVLLGFETFGLDLSKFGLDLGIGIDASYNTYRGVSLGTSTSVGIGLEGAGLPMNLGLSMTAGDEGLNISPNISFSAKANNSESDVSGKASLGFGFNINSRAGLSAMSLNYSYTMSGSSQGAKMKDDEDNDIKDDKGRQKYHAGVGASNGFGSSSSVSFGQPTFTPQIDLPMVNGAGSGRFKIGGAAFAQDIDANITGYGSLQRLARNELKNPSYGYIYSEKANNNGEALHDFNREKDGSFTKEKKNLPLTNHTYDIFSIAAQGVGGSFRAYRNDAGYVYDKKATSPSTSVDFGLEIGPGQLIDVGFDFSVNVLESESKAWTNGNGAAEALAFRPSMTNDIKENVHFKMTGEKNVNSDPSFYGKLRSGQPVRFELDRNTGNFETPSYPQFEDNSGAKTFFYKPHRLNRQQRNTLVYQYTKKEVLASAPWKAKYISPHAKDHHIAEIVIIQPDGKRYVFGLAAYNKTQREISFNVGVGNLNSHPPLATPASAKSGIVTGVVQSDLVPGGSKRGIDHYYDETITPAYAHSWMLTEILSPDYVDITGNGPSSDDLGTYTLFHYGNNGQPDVKDFMWRTPFEGVGSASYMEGLRTDLTDDKANIIYGEKDIWYLRSIESKTQIAIFHTSDREDGLGANILGQVQTNKKLQKLDKIKLYSKQEYAYDPNTAVPIKTVHFEYDYSLCRGTPNSNAQGRGKLSLRKVYFTYKNSHEGKYSPYEFNYRTRSNTGTEFAYKYGEVDRWGVYKPVGQLPNGFLSKSEYPYAVQDKTIRDDYSAAWHLDRISLPSGGKISVSYESDDYAFVQNRDAMRMFHVLGFHDPDGPAGNMGHQVFSGFSTKDYIVVQLDRPVATDDEFRTKYLAGYNEGNKSNGADKSLYFRFLMNVNKGVAMPDYEFVSGYTEIDGIHNCKLMSPGSDKALIKVKRMNTRISGVNTGVSPFSYAAWQFSRISTPRKAYNQPEPTDSAIDQFIKTLASADMFSQLVQFFQGPNGRMMMAGYGSKIHPQGSWVRLMDPDKQKLGGGNRVKEIVISDEWKTTSPSETSARYGQEFSYTTDKGYSSGVAAYEPGTGADENPFRRPVFYDGPKQILIPDERYYMEEPFGESFFPSPTVGYSQVTIKDKVFDSDVTLNRTGKTVHEFYTAYDFPTECSHTTLMPQQRKSSVLGQLLKIDAKNYMTATQGYVVHLNDMHGKPKSESMYAEGENSPFAYTKYHYKRTSAGKLDNTMDVISPDGKVNKSLVGVETDFVADMREQSTTGQTIAVTANIATFLIGFIPIPIPTVFPTYSKDRTRFRSATTTKVVYSFGLQDRTETYDNGAYVETKITALDGQTGEALVQQLNNEYKDKYYKLDYPAHWAYSGMAQASRNIGYTFDYTGTGSLSAAQHAFLEPGDEVLPVNGWVRSRKGSGAPPMTANTSRLWVSADATGKYLIDHMGKKFFPGTAKMQFKVIRSGHRNMQSLSLGSVTSVESPIKNVSGENRIAVDAASRVIAASAVEYSERWKTQRGMLKFKCDSVPSYPALEALVEIMNIWNQTEPEANGGIMAPIPSNLLEYIHFTPTTCEGISDVFMLGGIYDCMPGSLYGVLAPSLPPQYDVPEEYTGLLMTFAKNEETYCCGNTVIFFLPEKDCSEFSEARWADIVAYSGYEYIGNKTVRIYATMSDMSMESFIFHIHGDVCLSFDSNEVTYDCTPAYTCEYAEGDTINPYLYGILGNWRTSGDYFFMGDRNKTSASTAENLRSDGHIPNFVSYWSAPVSSTGVWNVNTAVNIGEYENWNWKTRMTLYSPYGFDIENVNPLPAYSSAQYGYQNTMPLAVANNAMQKEIGYDGFEDYYPWIARPECERGHFKFEDNESDISYTQAHTGSCSMGISDGNTLSRTFPITPPYTAPSPLSVPYVLQGNDILKGFSPNLGENKRYVLGFWAKPETRNRTEFDYAGISPDVEVDGLSVVVSGSLKKSKIISDWQRYELEFDMPSAPTTPQMVLKIANANGQKIYVDDIRVHPFDANLKSFVYHMFDMRYLAQLDENNFATFYEYDEEGKLVRVKKETERGIMTLQENRSNTYKR